MYLEHSRTQAIDLSIKPIFGTLRNEELLSPSGDILAICDVELSYAYVVIEATDVNMGIIDGLGVNGDEVLVGSIYCRYLGAENGRILFEVSPGRSRRSLAGTAQTLKNFVAMEGVFHESDWIGIGIDSGSMLIVSLKSSDLERSETGNSAILRSQIKREILRRGINSQIQNSGARDSTVAARCFFMKRVPDADHN